MLGWPRKCGEARQVEGSRLVTRVDAVLWTLRVLGGNGRKDEYEARLGFWGLKGRLSINASVGKKVEKSKVRTLRNWGQ